MLRGLQLVVKMTMWFFCVCLRYARRLAFFVFSSAAASLRQPGRIAHLQVQHSSDSWCDLVRLTTMIQSRSVRLKKKKKLKWKRWSKCLWTTSSASNYMIKPSRRVGTETRAYLYLIIALIGFYFNEPSSRASYAKFSRANHEPLQTGTLPVQLPSERQTRCSEPPDRK